MAAIGVTLSVFASNAAEVRATLAVNATVAVAGSVSVTTAASTEQQTAMSSAPSQSLRAATCTAVALICAGPPSMRVTLTTEGSTIESSDGVIAPTPRADLCSNARSAGAPEGRGEMLICGAGGGGAEGSMLGVTIDY